MSRNYQSANQNQKLNIYTDGCSLSNGKSNPKGGWAYVVEDGVLADGSGSNTHERQGNNRYELHAVNEALKGTLKEGGKYDVTIHTDSHYAIKSTTEWINTWKTNNYTNSKGGPVENADLVRSIDSTKTEIQRRGGSVQFKHVEAHSGNYHNERADRNAKDAAARNQIKY